MKLLFLKISGLASLVLLLHTSGFAQQLGDDKDNAPARTKSYDEIIIRHKSDKDAKVTIEIKDGEVLVNGKPVSDFEDSSLSIHQRKFKVLNNRNFSFSGPDGAVLLAPGSGYDGQAFTAPSPYGNHSGGWSYGGGDMAPRSNHAFLGVSSEKPSDGEGARIVGVTEGSAAEKFGLKKGDVITKINETPVTDPESLSATIRTRKPGDKVVVTLTREGKVQKETVTLGKTNGGENLNFQFRMPDMPDMKDFDFNGTMPREFGENFGNSLKFGIKGQDTEDGKGVKVLDVDDESAAAKAGIKEGDIITRFDGKEVNSATALAEAAHAAKEKASVKISLLRDGKSQEIDVKVPKRLRTANL